MKGAKETILFDIDASGTLLKQAPPNDGVLNSVGKLGISGKEAAFDIATDAGGVNAAWVLAGDTLYKVDLTNGGATVAGKVSGVSGTVRDMASCPRPCDAGRIPSFRQKRALHQP